MRTISIVITALWLLAAAKPKSLDQLQPYREQLEQAQAQATEELLQRLSNSTSVNSNREQRDNNPEDQADAARQNTPTNAKVSNPTTGNPWLKPNPWDNQPNPWAPPAPTPTPVQNQSKPEPSKTPNISQPQMPNIFQPQSPPLAHTAPDNRQDTTAANNAKKPSH